jgi:hypothetical protein
MTRSKLAAKSGRLILGAWALVGFVPSQTWGAEMKDFIYTRYPQPVGLLRPNSYYGFFQTQWQPWQFGVLAPDAIPVGGSPAHEGSILPPPMPVVAPPSPWTSPAPSPGGSR